MWRIACRERCKSAWNFTVQLVERRNLETMGVAIGCTNVECFGAADIPMNGVQQFAHQEEGDACRPQRG